ncbi:MAG: LptF/LptG family permease [Thermocrinis sp.]|jgi:lipopolysaccharide export LptBFGC system permease protein LptF|uniref:LptF/LptG family permease n=1 Tax=Thermocrinis sp. TaxID=2024383 RepID=UPI003C0CE03B
MLFFYNLREFLKVLLLLSLVFSLLLGFYSLTDVLLLYKVSAPHIILKAILTTVFLSFYYTAPILNCLALMIYIRRVFKRSYDRLSYSFGLSPLRFFTPVLVLSLILSLLQLVLSYGFYPKVFKNAYEIEKEFKKGNTKEELVLNNFWLSLGKGEKRFYIRIGFANLMDGRVYDVFSVYLQGNYIYGVLYAKEGLWKDKSLTLIGAERSYFDSGLKEKKDITLEFISVDNAKAFGEKLNHLRMDRLISLYSLAGSLGMNKDVYLAELLLRLVISISVLALTLPLAYHLLKERSFLKPSMFFLLYIALYILSLNLINITAQELGRSPLWGALPFFVLVLLSFRSLYYLGKGFRV